MVWKPCVLRIWVGAHRRCLEVRRQCVIVVPLVLILVDSREVKMRFRGDEETCEVANEGDARGEPAARDVALACTPMALRACPDLICAISDATGRENRIRRSSWDAPSCDRSFGGFAVETNQAPGRLFATG